MKRLLTICLIFLFAGGPAKGEFYIDYQGLSRHAESSDVSSDEVTTPNGYRLLTDGLDGLVYEVGSRPTVEKVSTFGSDVEFKYAIGAIIPQDWSAYVDENIRTLRSISFSASDEPWLNVLASVGSSFGYKFVVNWEHRIVQVSLDEHYVEPDVNAPITVEGPEGELYYIYKTKQSVDQGYIIVDGELLPLRITK